MPIEIIENRSYDVAPDNGLHDHRAEEDFFLSLNELLAAHAPSVWQFRSYDPNDQYLDFIRTTDHEHRESIVPSGRLRKTISLDLNGVRPEEWRMVLLCYATSLAKIGLKVFIEVWKKVKPDEALPKDTYVLGDRKVSINTFRLFVSSQDPESELITQMLQIEVSPYTPSDRDDLHVWDIDHTRCSNFRLPIQELTEVQRTKVFRILSWMNETEALLAWYQDYIKQGMRSSWSGEKSFTRPSVFEDFQEITEWELRNLIDFTKKPSS
jgi:hypothetical protein